MPALKFSLAFCIGIILSYFVTVPLSYIGIILLGSCVLYLFVGLIGEKSRGGVTLSLQSILIFLIIGIAGMLWYGVRTTLFPQNHIRNYLSQTRELQVIGRVIGDPEIRVDHTMFKCEAESLLIGEEQRAVTGKLRITLHINNILEDSLEKYPMVEYGDRILACGRLSYPEFQRNPASFDYRAWLKRRDIYALMSIWSPDNIRIIGKETGNPIISKLVLPMKRHIRNTIDLYFSWIQGPFLKAIVIRERGAMPAKIREYFENTGTIHVLAVSGLHVGIITFIIYMFFTVLSTPRVIRQILTSIFLIIYAFMIDLRPPIVRATIIAILGMIAFTTEKDFDVPNLVGVAALFILFLNPQALFDVSFQLSFTAVLWIACLYPKIHPLLFREIKTEQPPGIKKFILYFYRFSTRLFTVSLSAQLGLMPLIAYYFFRVPIISIIANLFVIPLTGVCIALTFIMSIFNLLPWQIPVQIFASASWAATTGTLKIVELFARIPYSHFWVGKTSILLVGFSYLLLLSGVNLHISRIARKVFIYTLLLLLNFLLWSQVYRITHPKLKVTFLDVSHGDCVFIEVPRGGKILIDGGPWKWGTNFDAGARIVTPFLRAKGVSNLDLVIATNPKIYRIGGLRYITENFKIKEFVIPHIAYSSWSWLNLLQLLDRKEIPCRIIDTETPFCKMLRTYKGEATKVANVSLKLKYGGISFLFPGDVTPTFINTKATVISVPKHGNKYRFSKEWMESINPRVAIISCGRNPWGEPDPYVIHEYRGMGAKVLRTDEEGAITITTDGNTLNIETMKQLHLRESMEHRLLRYTGWD